MKRADPALLRAASQALSTALADAGAAAEIARLVIAAGHTNVTDEQHAERVATAAGRFAGAVEQLLEAALQEAVEADEELLAGIRRWFVEPRETYTVEELAAMLRITVDDARDVYRDEIARWERLRGTAGDASATRIGWTAALVTAAVCGLLRPFDIERALGADFVEARSGQGWRTVPVLIRIPRFVADAIAREPVIPQTLPLPHRIERILFEQFRSGRDSDKAGASMNAAGRRGPHRETPLQQYLDRNGIPSAAVEAALRERMGGRAPHRKTMARWRLDRRDVRRKDMVRILWAVRVASKNPSVRIEEIFDLHPENADNWRD